MKFLAMRVWGLRLRRTEQELALALLLMLPTAHVKGGGVRIGCFRSARPTPPSPYLRTEFSRYQPKTRGRADRYSLLVRFFHPLLHAGCRVRQWRGPGFE